MRPAVVVLTCALASVVTLGACSSNEQPRAEETTTGNASQDAETTHFVAPDDWYTRAHVLDVRSGGIPVAWASNVPFKSADLSEPNAVGPIETVRALPSHGIVIVAVGPRRYDGNANFPHLSLPISVDDGRHIADGYEGQLAPHVSFGYVDTWVGDDRVLNVHYYIGTNDPSADLLAKADRALATLSLGGPD